jgi:PAS domain S-box-containing protein
MMNTLISSILGEAQDPAERNRQLFEEAPVAYHEIDRDGVIREVNRTECALLGQAREELIGHYVWEFVAAEHQQTSRDAIARKIAREQPLLLVTREYRRSDGSYIWLEIHEKLIENEQGEVLGIRSALLDITDRHKFDTEIRRQHDWMRLVLRSIGIAIITADALGNVDFMNPAAESLTGWTKQEALGRTVEEISPIWHDPGEVVDLMSCILKESVTSNRLRKFVVVDRSGVIHQVRWNISPVCNDDDVITGAVLALETA